jgi:hypothetical protein
MNAAYQNNRGYKLETMTITPTLKAQLKKAKSFYESSYRHGKQKHAKNRKEQETVKNSIEVELEMALLSLGRCCDLVRPAGTFSAQSVSRQEWKYALGHLQDFMNRIGCCCDPDRPFPAEQWGMILQE